MAAKTTKFTDTRLGTGLKGNELDDCYTGQVGDVNQRHGYGKYAYPNPMFTYEGEYMNGRKHGVGRLVIGDGFYEGDFADDEIQGNGTRVWADGRQFTGYFEMGEPVGHGVFLAANGDRYKGEVKGYTRQGEGVLQLANGDVYTGAFSSHKYNGVGELISADGSRHYGSWVDGVPEGEGDYTSSCGDTYQGTFSKGLRSGKGVAFNASSGITYNGQFKGGEPELHAERIKVTDPPQAEPGTKGAEISEVTVGIQPEWRVTVQVQHKVERLVDESELPAGKKGKKGEAEPTGPQLVEEWHPLAPESGRRVSLHILEGDLTAAAEEEIAAAEMVPLNPVEPDITEVVAVTQEGIAVFPPLLLGKPEPLRASDTSSQAKSRTSTPASKKPTPAPPAAEAAGEAEEEPVFLGGTYTLRFSSEGVSLAVMKLNVIGGDGSSGGKKGKK